MDADFYTMKYFDDKFSSKNFFEIQRLAHPFLVSSIPSDNKIVYTLLSNYADRIKDADSLEKKLDDFIDSDEKYIINCKEIEDALKELSFNDLMYYNDLADVCIYKGRYGNVCHNVKFDYYGSVFQTDIITEDGLPYAHYSYDLILKDFLKMIDLEKNYRFSEAILNKYGIFNVRDFSYDDFVGLMTSMAIKFNDNFDSNSSFKSSDYSRLFKSISDIVSIYNDYSLNFSLDKICLKKLSIEKLTELNSVLNLASDLLKYGEKDLAFSSFMLIKNSDVEIDIRRLDEAISICENNDLKTISLVKNEIMTEISDRRNKNISFKRVNNFIDDMISEDNLKILKK